VPTEFGKGGQKNKPTITNFTKIWSRK